MFQYGIWIDHSKAIVLKLDAEGKTVSSQIDSEIEPHHHGGKYSGEHHTIVNQNKANHSRDHEMNAFLKKILKELINADKIAVFGPGTAKFDLKNAIEDEKSLAGKLKACETTDELTEPQIQAKFKEVLNLI